MLNIKRIIVVGSICVLCAVAIYYTGRNFYDKKIGASIVMQEHAYQSLPVWHRKRETTQDVKIGIITDTQVYALHVKRDDPTAGFLRDEYAIPIKNFVAQMEIFEPDFVVHLGDIIEGTSEPEYKGRRSLQLVQEALEKTNVPVHYVMGNHDLRPLTKAQFLEVLSLEKADRVIDRGDYRFIILDANYNKLDLPRGPHRNRYIPGKLADQTLVWLEEQLRTDKHVFVFMHHGTFLDASQGDTDHKTKKSIKNARALKSLLERYNVDAFFNGHLEAKRFEESNGTEYYSLPGTVKSQKYPQSYYELTITDATAHLDMFYALGDTRGIAKIDFKNDEGIDARTKPADANVQDVSLPVVIIKTPAKKGSGLEKDNGQWIAVDDDGLVYAGDEKVYEDSNDLEGIALCSDRYYLAVERSDAIMIIDKDFKRVGSVPFTIGSGNTGAEGIACAPKGLYVTEQGGNTVYNIDLQGNLLGSFAVTHNDLSGADYSDGILYVLSDEADIIMVVKDTKVIGEFAVGKEGEWEGIKVSDGKAYIIEDDES